MPALAIKNKTIVAVDLFCGIGGLTRGLKNAKIDVKAGLDIDSSCKYAYESNNEPSRFIEKDIRDISFTDFEEFYNNADVRVLAGCAPCQPFSAHSNKKITSHNEDLFSLVGEFSRLVKEGKPEIISMENVPGLFRHDHFKHFINRLENLKYHISTQIVNCADYGVPQNRKRLVLLASLLNGGISLIKSNKRKKPVVKNFIKSMPPIKAGERHTQDKAHISMKLSELNMRRILQSKPGKTWAEWDEEIVSDCHRKSYYPSSYGRMRWDAPAPTITTQFCYYSTGRYGHPQENRAISIREGALLQTFPRDYKLADDSKEIPPNQIAKHIGNAVPVYLGEAVGRSIYHHVKSSK